ncbi:MAG: UDP-N-acetylmuramoyl-tripeptide--D-alanyl-D-alanine ligase [Fimbriimonadaceae bacterium]|nr:UDP-N-acetylmuramoyl-tripeptide--D-alanyl-D-alanine ligase [Fimbriimonadaceae bacterium]QYK55285.1 MAG: UDP-N-acetylmuramoyl-tripeptide--D-alanyl-D-alanine ligase [Fimbriimonadaceae bacterium]
MRPVALGQFAGEVLGAVRNADPDLKFHGFAWDSRNVKPGDLFLAVQGAHHDGHDYVEAALLAGAVAALVERSVPGPSIQVESLFEALARFAAGRRDRFEGGVVGITGSNGKTTTKEMVAAALSSGGAVLKSPANHNTELTAPLVWAEVEGKAFVVAELAMRGFGQIAHLARFTRPTVGLVTGIGTAHIEMVGSREGILRAKSEMLEAMGADAVSVLPRDDDFYPELLTAAPGPVVTFGFSQEADVRIIGYRAESAEACEVLVDARGEAVAVRLPTVGRHQAANAAAALAVAGVCGVPYKSAAENLPFADLPPMRMERSERAGATVILDTYNASPDSTVAAITTFDEIPVAGRRLAVLGDMRELGEFTESGHRLVGRAIASSRLDHALLLGPSMRYAAEEAAQAGWPSGKLEWCESLDIDKGREVVGNLNKGDALLVKGSRALGLEQILTERAAHP